MRPSMLAGKRPRTALWDLLTFDRLLTGPLTHLIYWAGLGLIALVAFTAIGAAVGLAIRSGALEGLLLAFPALVGGLLVAAACALIWRGMCEFYVAVFRIAEDLRALRMERAGEPVPPPSQPLNPAP